jgi:hypothetical protein
VDAEEAKQARVAALVNERLLRPHRGLLVLDEDTRASLRPSDCHCRVAAVELNASRLPLLHPPQRPAEPLRRAAPRGGSAPRE